MIIPDHWTRHSLAALLTWLAVPTTDGKDQRAHHLARHAGATLFRMVPDPHDPNHGSHRGLLEQFWKGLSDELPCDRPSPAFAAGNLNGGTLLLRYWVPQSIANPRDAAIPESPGFLCLDLNAAESEPEMHLGWRRWLWLFNTFQLLPGFFLATRDGVAAGDHSNIVLGNPAQPASSGSHAAIVGGWERTMDQAMAFLREGLSELQAAGLPIPDEVGYELDEAGEVVAECELAWTSLKVALLLEEQVDLAPPWIDRGWKAVIAQAGWPQSLIEAIHETLAGSIG